jgi:signal transduction histidine kinase
VLAAVVLAGSSGFRILEGDDLGELGYELVASVIPLAAVIALGDAVRSRRGWRVETRRRARIARVEREQEAARRVEQERVRIARELHDVLAHTVSVIAIQADVAAEALPGDPAAAQAALGSIRSASRDALGELRTTLGLLREPDGDVPLDPVAGLAQLDAVVGAAADSGLAVAVRTTGRPVPLPAVVDTAAQRIIQEALTNVLRHAGATAAQVELCYGPTALTVRVTDDGRGGGAGGNGDGGTGRAAGGADREGAGGGGYGIQGMRERAALLGGRLRAGPRPEGGFGVEVSLPLGAPS